MDDHDPEIDAIIARQKANFIEKSDARLNSIDAMIHTLRTDGDANGDVMETFNRQIHSIRGISGTFGFSLVATICHKLEAFVRDERVFSDGGLDCLQDTVDCIRSLVERGEVARFI